MSDSHAPRSSEPQAAVLAPNSLVRDVTTGERLAPDAWIDAQAATEGRPRDEVVDALMNAIARGDLVVEPPGAV